jgi:hypothetical protein
MAENKEAREILYGKIKRGTMGRAECEAKTKNELKRKRKITVMKQVNETTD